MQDLSNTEDELPRSAALQNANSAPAAGFRAEGELLDAKNALERRTHELADSLAVMRATLESTGDGILVTSADGVVMGFSHKYVEMWNVPRESIAATTHRQLLEMTAAQFPDPEKFLARVDEIYATAPPESFDVLELADGRTYERYSRIPYVDGQPAGRVWSFRDMTQRRRAEDALGRAALENALLYEAAQKAAVERERLLESERLARAEAERMSAAKDEFLATLSHELRTPLSAILGWTHILKRGTADPALLMQGVDTIERSARAQTRLIEDMLDMSRITSGKLRLDVQPVEPASFVHAAIETIRPAADAKGIDIANEIEFGVGPVSGDPNRLQQVIWNLLSNAIKFTPSRGKVRVTLARADSHVEIRVADSGAGIRSEFLPYVFDRFRQADTSTTRRYGGLGLGLSIVKHLTELHGGTVRADSEGEGCGSCFTIRLPLAIAARSVFDDARLNAQALVIDTFRALDLSGVKILVLDDEADAREIMKRVLGQCDAEVLTAGNAHDALRMITAERPHVLVSDIGMPDVDGYEFLRRVRAMGEANGGSMPAIAVTAFARPEDRMRALRAGYLVHLAKPVEPSELVATVATVAGRVPADGGA